MARQEAQPPIDQANIVMLSIIFTSFNQMLAPPCADSSFCFSAFSDPVPPPLQILVLLLMIN